MRRAIREARGTSTVELALILPALVLLLIGIVDVGVSLNAYVTVTNASREAANYAISHPSAAPSAIASAATSRSVPLAPERMTVNASYYDGATFQPWPAGGVPSGSPTARPVAVRVEVSYPWSATTILIGAFFGGSSVSLRGSSTMEVTW